MACSFCGKTTTRLIRGLCRTCYKRAWLSNASGHGWDAAYRIVCDDLAVCICDKPDLTNRLQCGVCFRPHPSQVHPSVRHAAEIEAEHHRLLECAR